MKATIYVHWKQYDWEEEGELLVSSHNMSTQTGTCANYKLLKTEEIDFDVTPPIREEIAKTKTDALIKQKNELLAETEIKCRHIDDKIRQLAALTYEVEA